MANVSSPLAHQSNTVVANPVDSGRRLHYLAGMIERTAPFCLFRRR
jgi:hypothetical protein